MAKDAMPEFGPDHPSMTKGFLKWITPSTFIKAMGGPHRVALVKHATRNGLAPQTDPWDPSGQLHKQ